MKINPEKEKENVKRFLILTQKEKIDTFEKLQSRVVNAKAINSIGEEISYTPASKDEIALEKSYKEIKRKEKNAMEKPSLEASRAFMDTGKKFASLAMRVYKSKYIPLTAEITINRYNAGYKPNQLGFWEHPDIIIDLYENLVHPGVYSYASA